MSVFETAAMLGERRSRPDRTGTGGSGSEPRRRNLRWRLPLGFLAAVIAPALILWCWFFLIVFARWGWDALVDATPRAEMAKLGFAVVELIAITSMVTVPAAVIFGIPLIAWFLRSRWFQWWAHALAGFAVGLICGLVLFALFAVGGPPPLFIPLFAAFGVAATSAYWLVAFGGRRAWTVTAGLFGTTSLGALAVNLAT